ncbi:MAG: bifunctional folylpolyglutamate synthase/dihydrofolate synthase [Bacillati bacterium ANGP1]|uniref:tetrahydrofolate synthase n=1 Tax=Candidatus Segetimicrobium genomatis TaxID=2569760 RepID=A0A537JGA7_9BACT|nr:MAG: bifunctional folylpolyglutamate synthase/dihydrofolate synthase [Terrabacteria group bacterium ANGP1]
MTYAAALRFLDGLIRADQPRQPYREVKLARMFHLLGLLGDPHRRLKTVLVAGTKGKGSTAVMIAGILRAQGLRVGLTVKPHLTDYRERIQLAGRMIPRAALATLVEQVRPAVEAGRALAWGPPTYVETTVAMAFLYFAQQRVDLAVVEVGIGGRLDATNVLDPLVAVLTPISYDHMEILGGTLTEIATEKAGIIRAGGRVAASPQPDEALRTIARASEAQHARLVLVGRDVEARIEAVSLAGVRATIRGLRGTYPIRLPLLGRHQGVNAATAIAAVELLADRVGPVSAGAVRRGLAAVRWPARVELIETRPYTIVDMGHNPASMAALRETLQELLGGRRLVLVFGMLETKDYRTVTAMIAPLADAVVTTTPDNPHALPAAALAAEVRKYTARVTALPDRRDAVEHGRALAGPEDVLVVTGSVYLVGEAREWLRRRKPAATTRR